MTNAQGAEHYWVLVGTYTHSAAEGIYVCRLDTSTGALSRVGQIAAVNPTFLAVHPTRDFVYAVGETGEYNARPGGSVSSYAFDRKTGRLTPLNTQPSGGAGPCHLTVDKTGRFLLVANYSGGSVSVLPIHDDGRLGEAVDTHQHTGSSVNANRQKSPHPHSVQLDASNRFAFVPDLGIDRVVAYRFDSESGKLTADQDLSLSLHPGAGPRHMAFHPQNKYAYVINELDSTVTACRYDQETGRLRSIQTISTLPPDFNSKSWCAEVLVHPSGAFLYGSNRGHDSIAIFRIDPETGTLTLTGHASTQGRTPRNFALDPSGRYLFAENQESDTIVTFAIDPADGRLLATGHSADVPSPVCIRMISC